MIIESDHPTSTRTAQLCVGYGTQAQRNTLHGVGGDGGSGGGAQCERVAPGGLFASCF